MLSPSPPTKSGSAGCLTSRGAVSRSASNRVHLMRRNEGSRVVSKTRSADEDLSSQKISSLQEKTREELEDGFRSIFTWAHYQMDFLPPPDDVESRRTRVLTLCSIFNALMPRICSDIDLWHRIRSLLFECIFIDGAGTITKGDQIESNERDIADLLEQMRTKRAALKAARRIADSSLEKSVLTSVKTVFVAWRTYAQCENRARRRFTQGFTHQHERMAKLKRFVWWRQLALSAKLRRAVRQQARGFAHRPSDVMKTFHVSAPDKAEVETLRQRLSEESLLRDRQFEAFSFEISGLNADVSQLTQRLRQCQAQKALWRSLYLSVNTSQCLVWGLSDSVMSACDALDSVAQRYLGALAGSSLDRVPTIHGFHFEPIDAGRGSSAGWPKACAERRKSTASSSAALSRLSSDEAESSRQQVKGKLETLLIQWVNAMLTRREEVLETLGAAGSESSRVRTLTSLREDLHDGEIYEALLDAIELGTKFTDVSSGRSEESGLFSKGSERSISMRHSKGMVAGARRLVESIQKAISRGSGSGSCLPPWCQSLLASCTSSAILREVFDDEAILFGDVTSHMWVLSTLLVDFCVQLQGCENTGRAMGLSPQTASKCMLFYSRFYSPGAPKSTESSVHPSFRSRSSQLITVPSSESIIRQHETARSPAPAHDLLRVDASQSSSRNLTARRSTVAPRGSFHTQPPRSNRPSIFDMQTHMTSDDPSPSIHPESESNLLLQCGDTPPTFDAEALGNATLPQISISMGFDEDIMETKSLGESGVFNRSLGWSGRGVGDLLPGKIDGASYFLEGQQLPVAAIANPTESLIHLRWYRESFDPQHPLEVTDYLRLSADDPKSSNTGISYPERPSLGSVEHPPYLAVPRLMETIDKSFVDYTYDAAQWHAVGQEIKKRQADWLTLGQVVALAVVGCRCLDVAHEPIGSALAPPNSGSSHQGPRSRQHSRNTISEGRQNSAFAPHKRSLSNSHRSGSAGSNNSNGVMPAAGQAPQSTASPSPRARGKHQKLDGRPLFSATTLP